MQQYQLQLQQFASQAGAPTNTQHAGQGVATNQGQSAGGPGAGNGFHNITINSQNLALMISPKRSSITKVWQYTLTFKRRSLRLEFLDFKAKETTINIFHLFFLF